MGFVSAGRGLGSTFYFELPLLSPTQADVPKPTLFPPSLPVTTNDAHNNRIDDLHVYSLCKKEMENTFSNVVDDDEIEEVEFAVKVKKEIEGRDSSKPTSYFSNHQVQSKVIPLYSPGTLMYIFSTCCSCSSLIIEGSGKIFPEESLIEEAAFPTNKALRILIVVRNFSLFLRPPHSCCGFSCRTTP